MTAQTPTPDNTRRETIEECARIAEDAAPVVQDMDYAPVVEACRNIALDIRALASAEPQAWAAAVDQYAQVEQECPKCRGFGWTRSPNGKDIPCNSCLGDGRICAQIPRPASATAAETEGLVKRLRAMAQARKAQEALCFADGGSEIDQELAYMPEWQAADLITSITSQLAARTQTPEIAEALKLADEALRPFDEAIHESSMGLGQSNSVVSSLKLYQAARTARQAIRLFASTGSRQELAGDPDRLLKDAVFACIEAGGADREYGGVLTSGDRMAWVRFTTEPAALRSQPASRDSGEAMREAWRPIEDHDGTNDPVLAQNTFGDMQVVCWDGGRWETPYNYFYPTHFRALPTSHSGSAS